MEPGFQAIVDCMLEAGWTRGEIMRSLRRLIAADNITQKENAKVEAQIAIARAMMRAGKLNKSTGTFHKKNPSCELRVPKSISRGRRRFLICSRNDGHM